VFSANWAFRKKSCTRLNLPGKAGTQLNFISLFVVVSEQISDEHVRICTADIVCDFVCVCVCVCVTFSFIHSWPGGNSTMHLCLGVHVIERVFGAGEGGRE